MDSISKIVLDTYQHTYSIRDAAKAAGVGEDKARKILVTAGVNLHSKTADKVLGLHRLGLSKTEIMEKLNLSKQQVNKFLPYVRSSQNRWTDEEISLLQAGLDVPGRSRQAMRNMRWRLNHKWR